MRDTVEKFFTGVDKVFFVLSFLSLGTMAVLITLQVFFRFVLNAPLAWTEELARFGFIWSTFFAGYLGARKAQHIGVELVQDLFPITVKKGMKSVSALIAGGFFVLIPYYLVTFWPKLASQTSAALNIPMNWVYLGMLVGCFFTGLSYIWDAVKIWLPEDESRTVKEGNA